MDDIADLLQIAPLNEQTATLFVTLPDGANYSIYGLSVPVIGYRCPVFALCFEERADGSFQGSIEASSRELVVCFLRFLYINTYSDFHGDVLEPRGLLLDVELYHMGDVYDIPELQVEAYSNLIRKTELACSLPYAPEGLCDAIRFTYENLERERGIVEVLLNYCVNCFFYHQLSQDEHLLRLVVEIKPFHDGLAQLNCERGFEDDGAAQIIQLPFARQVDTARAAAEKKAMEEFLSQLWCGAPLNTTCGDKAVQDQMKYQPAKSFSLPHRPRIIENSNDHEMEEDALYIAPRQGRVPPHDRGYHADSESEGFTLVHRPKPNRSPLSNVNPFTDSESESESSAFEDLGDNQPTAQNGAAMNESSATIVPSSRVKCQGEVLSESECESDGSEWTILNNPFAAGQT
jgi:hypothetical protein